MTPTAQGASHHPLKKDIPVRVLPRPSMAVSDPRVRAEREAALRQRTDTVGALRRMRQIVEDNRLL
ncbi:MAG: hypothetical protein K5872_17905 [Rhizobiaceae bacterium]|nr:hypothetical protein [Rhizobiaceae bacterium]MCV0408100.1 hypothetical protein [Rhizobiaceae bacterium]